MLGAAADTTPVAVTVNARAGLATVPATALGVNDAIWDAQLATPGEVIAAVGGAERVVAIGITNQRETVVVWDRSTGRPVAGRRFRCSSLQAPSKP